MSFETAKQRILDRVPLQNLIGETVKLEMRSGRPVGICPFHDEKSGSFTIYDTHYHCFGCQAHGDAIDFVREKLGLSFMEALKHLSEKYNIPAPELQDSRKAFHDTQKLSKQFNLLKSAWSMFVKNLHETEAGKQAQEYLLKRGFTPEQIKDFGLGVSLDQPAALCQYFMKRGHNLQQLTETSLAIKSSRSGQPFDFFQHRIMIPIHDRFGRIVGFGGRTLGTDPAKYKNSRETEVFDKSRTLYGFHRVREDIRKKKRVIVVEGYMDAMALWSGGFRETVACLGTALTLPQLQILSQVTEKVILLFDGDGAGLKAGLRTVSHALKLPKLQISVGLLPQGEDPDSYLRGQGADQLESLMVQAPPLLEHAIHQKIKDSHDLGIPHLIKNEFIPWLKAIEDNLLRSYLTTKISELCGVPRDALTGTVQKTPQPPPAPPPEENPQPQVLAPPSKLVLEVLGQIYWSQPGDLNLERTQEFLDKSLKTDLIWLQLMQEFLRALKDEQAPSERQIGDWNLASHPSVLDTLNRVKGHEIGFGLSASTSRQANLELLESTIEEEGLKTARAQLKEQLYNIPKDTASPEETFAILKSIKQMDQRLAELKKSQYQIDMT